MVPVNKSSSALKGTPKPSINNIIKRLVELARPEKTEEAKGLAEDL